MARAIDRPAIDAAGLVRRALEERCREVFAPDFVFHGPPELFEANCPGAGLSPLDSPFSDETIEVDDVRASGDRVVARYHGSGRHSRTYRGVRPSGRARRADVVAIYRLDGDRIAEGWATMSWA